MKQIRAATKVEGFQLTPQSSENRHEFQKTTAGSSENQVWKKKFLNYFKRLISEKIRRESLCTKKYYLKKKKNMLE